MINLSPFSDFSIRNWFALIFDSSNSLFCSPSVRAEFIVFTAALLDNIWFFRNKIAHGASIPPFQELLSIVSRQIKMHWFSIVKTGISNKAPSPVWIPPPLGFIKVNTDASFKNGVSKAGIIFRNHSGTISLAATYHHNCLDSFSAECLALLDACKILQELKNQKVCLESDCLAAITFINGNSGNFFWQASAVIDQFLLIRSRWPFWSFNFTPRVANGAAHALAFWAFNSNFMGFVPKNELPVSIFCDLGFPLVGPP
ncbi:hypothetical protein CASFOL_027524 [Castilleja foliolosa]|uniref:RNase H type-1 domain-containing protein n=1 Tax=Castilleja foliolosa TaxID=1961234 RepID=A0ABD3CF22_9LAMI